MRKIFFRILCLILALFSFITSYATLFGLTDKKYMVKSEQEEKNMQSQNKKTQIRYDETFKEGAIKMVTEQKIPVVQAAKSLGITDDTLRNWLKKAGIDPRIESKNNYLLKKVRELETQLKAKKAEVEQLKEANDILKKSIGIICNP